MQHTGIGRSRAHRSVAVAALLLVLLPLLSGCLRARVTMGVSGDDRVTGEIVLATQGGVQAPTLTPPRAIADRVSVRSYNQDGYLGSQVFFSDLSFAELQQLTTLTSVGGGAYRLVMRRSGTAVTLDGSVNLSTLRASGADVQLRVNFPGPVTTTNGIRDGDSGVRWQLQAGAVNTLQATADYSDPGTRGYQSWLLGVTLLVLVAAGVVVVMARKARDRSIRAGRH